MLVASNETKRQYLESMQVECRLQVWTEHGVGLMGQVRQCGADAFYLSLWKIDVIYFS